MRRYQYEAENSSPPHIMVLARLSNIYSDCQFEFHVNPWRLYTSQSMSIHGQCSFEVKISPESSSNPPGRLPFTAPKLLIPSLPLKPRIPEICTSARVSLEHEIHSSGPLVVGYTKNRRNNEHDLNNTVNGTVSDSERFPSRSLDANEADGSGYYSYKPLENKCIRLLHLLPDNDGTHLRGVIFHVPLESAVQFRAVSYVWGSMSLSETLWTPDGAVGITSNLHAALRNLRQKKDPLTLWVDAICINQGNLTEKAHQIRLLPSIFQRATSVFAFLGSDPQSQRALETLMQIRAKGVLAEWPPCLSPVPSHWSSQPVPPVTDPVWEDIKQFFRNPWFCRAWVIQEVVLAASVRIVCSKWIVDWNDLVSAVSTVHREYRRALGVGPSPDVLPWEYFLELAHHREWEARQTKWALINLFEPFRYLQSTWKRDRLFALLGIASDGADPAFEPDYKSPLEQVVLRFVSVFIRQGKVLQLLYRAGLGSQPHRFPSWVPDWTVLKPTSLYESSARGQTFCASWVSKPQAEYDAESDELRIRGHRLGSLQKVTKAANVPEEWAEYFEQIGVMLDISGIRTSYSASIRRDMQWKVPIAGAVHPKTLTGGDINLQSSYETFRCELLVGEMKRPGWSTGNSSEGDNYRLALGDHLYGWRFFVTQGDFVGLGPPSAAPGDLVYFFDGASVPFLLRRSDSRAGAYRLVGECYVYGMMNGEGARKSLQDEGLIRLH